MSERDFQQQFLDLAGLYGWRLQYHTHDSRHSAKGWPDLVVCRPPEVLFVELKTEKGRVSPDQIRQVFDAWVTATERNPARTKLTPDRQRRIEKALKSHGIEDCLQAVRHIGEDVWARGNNDRHRRFDDIEHALGSAKRIEGWRDAEPRRDAPTSREDRRARGASALRTMMSEAAA